MGRPFNCETHPYYVVLSMLGGGKDFVGGLCLVSAIMACIV